MIIERHKKIIAKCAYFSKHSYTNDTGGIFIEDVGTDAQAYVCYDQGDIIVTGQGTTTMKDWSIDFQIWKTKCDYLFDTKVHSGFLKQYNSIRSRIHEEIKLLLQREECKRILCTGHSLFGGVSTICALDCAVRYEIPIHCVTFGSPRVGGRDFVKMFNDTVDVSYRCVLKKDPVSFVPLPLRFKHVQGSVHFDSKLTRKSNKYNCIGCQISDHSMENYYNYATEMIFQD